MKLSIAIALLFAGQLAAQNSCWETATLKAQEIPAAARATYETKLAEARAEFERRPNDADAMIWVGRRMGYLADLKGAIRLFHDGAKKFPKDARFYRHSGHRQISLRCFDGAITDLRAAAALVKGQKDEIEPDGLPNARNTPTSTLQSNIWYHLALAYYLKGDLKNALQGWEQAQKVSTNPDMRVAATHWHYMTLRIMGRNAQAAKLLAGIPDNLDIIENQAYYQLLRYYKGILKDADMANAASDSAVAYGVANWHVYNGRRDQGRAALEKIVAGPQTLSFAYIAAEADLKRR